jgi:hypothetical protein
MRAGIDSPMPSAPTIPGPFDEAFLADLPYDPAILPFDRLLEVDREASRVRCRWTTRGDEPITNMQRNHPVRHPEHVSGALMVHATGMLGFVHAYYVLDLRHHEGWVGYGTHMKNVVFRKLVPPGEVIQCCGWAEKSRLGRSRHFVRYRIEFTHEGDLCYESQQSAMWLKTSEDAVASAPALT